MSEPQLPREVRRRLATIHHAEEVTGNVAMTCRYYGISRQVYYRWLRRYQEQGIDALRDLSRRPHHSPNATHVDVVGKILYLRQNYHFGPGKIAMYLKRYHDVEVSQSGVWRILKRLGRRLRAHPRRDQDRKTEVPPIHQMEEPKDHPLLHTFARFCQRARRAIVIPVRRKTIGTADKQHRTPSAETARNTVRPDNRPQPTQKGSAIMKQITAVVENTTLDEIQAALPDMPVWSTTVSTVHQYEGRDVATHVYRGVRYTTRFTDRVRLDIQVDDSGVDEVINWITFATEVGLVGPARVSIMSPDAVLDIRAGQSARKLAAAA
jgi:nitrogen regulatory protein PII/transposase